MKCLITYQNIIKTIAFGMCSGLILGKIDQIFGWKWYLGFIIFIYIIILSTFSLTSNKKIIKHLLLFTLTNYLSYLLINKQSSVDEYVDIQLYVIVFLVTATTYYVYADEIDRIQSNNVSPKRLYKDRERDFIEIKEAIKQYKIIGINGEWGEGKTFLMNYVKQELQDTYNFTTINTTAYEVDKIEQVIINELDSILRENGIFSIYSSLIVNSIENSSILKAFSTLIMEKGLTISDRIEGFRKDLDKLSKPVVIVFEDIDRLNSESTISKIFGVVNTLTEYSKNIKIIYEYNQDNLLSIFKNNSNFLEKYIPISIEVSKLGFTKIIDYIFSNNSNHFEFISPEMFYFLEEDRPFQTNDRILFSYNICQEFSNVKFSPRKVNAFLEEVNTYFMMYRSSIKYDIRIGDSCLPIIVCFIKHFMPKDYLSLKKYWLSPLDVFQICNTSNGQNQKNIKYSYSEDIFFKEADSRGFDYLIMNLLKNNYSNQNRKSLAIINEFGYRLDYKKDLNIIHSVSVHSKLLNLLLVTPEDALTLHNNRKIINQIRFMTGYKNNISTLEESTINVLFSDVLNKPENMQQREFTKFLDYIKSKRFNREVYDESIYEPFIDIFNSIFVAMFLSNRSKDDWDKFLYFFLPLIKTPSNILENNQYIGLLNYINIDDDKIFIKVIDDFNSRGVNVIKASHHTILLIFLNKYLSKIASMYNHTYVHIRQFNPYSQDDFYKNLGHIYKEISLLQIKVSSGQGVLYDSIITNKILLFLYYLQRLYI